jgi:Fur family zinc uptake transcriptional regulator|tara:strand:- start:12105 stop:12566 length:462 start_codon:yes stop_codon:yes gene_type:complete
MSRIETVINQAENSCKAHGAKLTNKRKQVLSGLLQSDKAKSAYELVDYCKREFGETLPPMSVYRILDFLQDEHLVHKLDLANKYIACAHITCDHAHGVAQFLICSNCQSVKEITVNKSTITTLKRNVEEAGFHLESPQLEMNCLCHNCKNKAA